MFAKHFLVFTLLSVAFWSVEARPNILAEAFVDQDYPSFVTNLPVSDRDDSANLARSFAIRLASGKNLTMEDYVQLAKDKYPSLYLYVLAYQRKMEEHENALPAKAKQFVLNRRAEVGNWFANGNLHVEEIMKSIRSTGHDIGEMTDNEKAALLKYYPHMQALLDNRHFRKIVNGSDDIDDLSSLLM